MCSCLACLSRGPPVSAPSIYTGILIVAMCFRASHQGIPVLKTLKTFPLLKYVFSISQMKYHQDTRLFPNGSQMLFICSVKSMSLLSHSQGQEFFLIM